MWSWYAELYALLQDHLLDRHKDNWQYIQDELDLFEEMFVYGEFKHDDEHIVSCPWAGCHFKLKFKTFVSVEVKE